MRECGERLGIAMGTMDLIYEGCGYMATPARLKYQKEKVTVDQSVRGTSEPDRKEVRIIDTGQYSEDDFTIMGLLNILNALEFTVEKSYEKPGENVTAQHVVCIKKGFRVHITAWYPK